jgi:hypothetical protein
MLQDAKIIGPLSPVHESLSENFVVEALAQHLPPTLIRRVLRQTGCDSQRRRSLPAELVVWLVILLGLFRRQSYVNLLEKIADSRWTAQHWEKPPTSSAVTQARDRLGLAPLQQLFTLTARQWAGECPHRRILNRRVLILDGTTAPTSDSPANAQVFERPPASRGRAAYPQLRAVLLVEAGSRLILDEEHGPYATSELALARRMRARIPPDSLLVMDRYFLAYDFLWDLQAEDRHWVLRLRDNIQVEVLDTYAPGDQLVRVHLPRYYRRSRPDLPRHWTLRMITYQPLPKGEVIRLLTTVLDLTVKRQELVELYGVRWGEETLLDEFKTHLCGRATVNHPVVFRSQTPTRVEQEWYGLLVAYNAVRRSIAQAVEKSGGDPLRVSFIGAVERLREAVREMMLLPTVLLPERHRQLLRAIARQTVPLRPGRHNPRAVKVKMSVYPLKSKQAA